MSYWSSKFSHFEESPSAEDIKKLGPDSLPYLPLDALTNDHIHALRDMFGQGNVQLDEDKETALKELLMAVSSDIDSFFKVVIWFIHQSDPDLVQIWQLCFIHIWVLLTIWNILQDIENSSNDIDEFSDEDLFSIAKRAVVFSESEIAQYFRFSKVGTLARLGEANWKNADQVRACLNCNEIESLRLLIQTNQATKVAVIIALIYMTSEWWNL